MPTDERKRWFSGPVQPAGLLVSAWFLFKLLALLHLSVLGKVAEGQTARLLPGDTQEPGEIVPYAYQTDVYREFPLTGTRRGIDYGGHRLSVVYSRFFNSYHTTSLSDLKSPAGLWREEAYVIHLTLYLVGILAGIGIYLLPKWLSKGGVGFSLMPGLTRDDPMNPR